MTVINLNIICIPINIVNILHGFQVGCYPQSLIGALGLGLCAVNLIGGK